MVCVYGQQMHALHDFNILFNTYTFQPRCLTGVKCFAFLVHNNFFLIHMWDVLKILDTIIPILIPIGKNV